MKYLATSLVTLIILIAVLMPGPYVPDVPVYGIDKIAHILLFSAWAVAVLHDIRQVRKFLVFVAGAGLSLSTEVVQLFVEDRSFDYYDLVADGIGLLVGIAYGESVIKLLQKLFAKSS